MLLVKTLQTLKRKVKNKYLKLAQEIYSCFFILCFSYSLWQNNRKQHKCMNKNSSPMILYSLSRCTHSSVCYIKGDRMSYFLPGPVQHINSPPVLRYSDNVPHFNWLCWVSKGGVVWMDPCWNLKMISIWILCFYWKIKWKYKSVQRQNPHKL